MRLLLVISHKLKDAYILFWLNQHGFPYLSRVDDFTYYYILLCIKRCIYIIYLSCYTLSLTYTHIIYIYSNNPLQKTKLSCSIAQLVEHFLLMCETLYAEHSVPWNWAWLCIPVILEQGKEDRGRKKQENCKFKVILDHMENSRPAWVTWDPISKKNILKLSEGWNYSVLNLLFQGLSQKSWFISFPTDFRALEGRNHLSLQPFLRP